MSKKERVSILFSKGNEVFYNPVQEVNRDLSIAVIKLFQEDEESDIVSNKDFTILEALSATGNVPNLLKSDKKKACVLSTMRRK